MKRINWFTGCCLVALAFAGAAVFESTRQSVRGTVAFDGLLYTTKSSSNPKLQLWPLDGLDIATFLICAVCLSLAGGAGIGGGAVLVPCFILIRGWPTSTAVAMSNVTVLGGSFANFICNVCRRRSNKSRMIDWELILMMEPTTIAGAIFGAILNKLLPTYLTTYLLLAFISFMAIRLNQKGRQAYDKETQLFKAAKRAAKAAAAAAAAQAGSSVVRHRHSKSLPIMTTGVAGQQQQQQQRPGSSYSRSQVHSVNSRNFIGSFTQSFSRLNAPLMTDFNGTSSTAARSWQQQQQQQRGDDQSLPLLLPAAARSANYGVPGAGSISDVTWLPDMLQSGSRLLLDLGSFTALCQGDSIGNNINPIIAVPLSPRLSGSSDDSAAAAACDDQIMEDLETGCDHDDFDRDHDQSDDHVCDSEDRDLHQDDLQQPLLPADDQHCDHDLDPSSSGGKGGSSSSSKKVDRIMINRLHSPDGVIEFHDEWRDYENHDDDVMHGSSDVNCGSSTTAVSHKLLGSKDAAVGDTAAAASSAAPASQPAVQGPRSEPCVPLPHFLTLLFLSAWVVVTDIIQGGTICGSWQYWIVTLSVLLPVVVILLVFRQILLKKYRHDLATSTVLPNDHDDQLHWTPTTTLLYPAICSTAGLIAGLFGIGGGVVKGPLMLELGVPPDVAAATSATMIMFTAASACVVYSRFGQLLLDYGIAMIVMGFVVTLGSQLLTFVLIKVVGRRSVIIFMMVVLMLMASSIMLLKSAQETLCIISNPSELKHFGRLCPTEDSNSSSSSSKSAGLLFRYFESLQSY